MLEIKPIYDGKYLDRSPNIQSSGKLIPVGERVETCLKEISPRPVTPPVVRKFLNTTRPDAGAMRVFYGKANDPDEAQYLVHGVRTRPSLSAGSLINPPLRTLFQQRLQERREDIYQNHQKAPLGRSYNQAPGLPRGLDLYKTIFGKKTHRVFAGHIINPPKSREQVEKEAQDGRRLYIRTHNHFDVGEQINRKYNWSKYTKDSKFGIATPNYNDGRNVARSLRWLDQLQLQKAATLVSKRDEDFRARTRPQIGKVCDPIADTLNVPPNHTFGMMLSPDEFGAGDLMHYTAPVDFLRGKDRQHAVLSAIREHLKKANFHNFSSLLESFRHYDKKGSGAIGKGELQSVCRQFNLDLNPQILDALLEYCDVDGDGQIDFMEFANFLNWKDKMPIRQLEEDILTKGNKRGTLAGEGESLVKKEDLLPKEVGSSEKTPRTLTRPQTVPDRFHTSSSVISAVVGGPSAANYRTYGVPTVRTDLAAPCIKRISDMKNYGDESSSGGLINPSLYSLKGVHEKHFFMSRPKEEIASIFRNIGVEISEETFKDVWKLASMRHPRGQVCVETFRNVLDEIQAMKMGYY